MQGGGLAGLCVSHPLHPGQAQGGGAEGNERVSLPGLGGEAEAVQGVGVEGG